MHDDTPETKGEVIELEAIRSQGHDHQDEALTQQHPGQGVSENQDLDFFIKEEALFRQNIQLDLEHERIILYRALVVLLWIGGMVLLRQWALALI